MNSLGFFVTMIFVGVFLWRKISWEDAEIELRPVRHTWHQHRNQELEQQNRSLRRQLIEME